MNVVQFTIAAEIGSHVVMVRRQPGGTLMGVCCGIVREIDGRFARVGAPSRIKTHRRTRSSWLPLCDLLIERDFNRRKRAERRSH